MMRRYLLFLTAGILLHTTARPQWWADAGLPVPSGGVSNPMQLYNDTANDALYVLGSMTVNFQTDSAAESFSKYQQGHWTTYAPFSNEVQTAVVYHDTLIIGGAFETAEGVSAPYIAYFDGSTWHPYGQLDQQVSCLRVLDDTLYALGAFTYADGQLCNGLARRINGSWMPVGYMGNNGEGSNLKDAIKFQGRLVVSGGIHFTGQGLPYKDVMQYDGTNWEPVGPYGVSGGFSSGGRLAVYQGELYMGGTIHLSEGNAGEGIMRWDGTAWHAVGSGIQDLYNSYQYPILMDLQVHDGLLYVGGGFSYAAHVPANCTATWDGHRWCSVGGEFAEYVSALTFFHDTLFVGCFTEADGQPVNHLARFIAPEEEDSCGVALDAGVADLRPSEVLTVAYHGEDGSLHFIAAPKEVERVVISDLLGRAIRILSWRPDGILPVPGLPQGVLLVRLLGHHGEMLAGSKMYVP